jgi:hypothetical protein
LFVWLIFICTAQASHPVGPTQASLLHCSITSIKVDMVTLSYSDTEEALELLSLSPVCGPHSRLSEPSSTFSSDLFEDWPKVNDMSTSVYVALIVDASNSHASTVGAPCGDQESHADGSCTLRSRSRAMLSRRSHRQEPGGVGAPRWSSKRAKINTDYTLAAPSLCDGVLSTADFNRSEWEIMYPRFVEGLVGPSNCVIKKNI